MTEQWYYRMFDEEFGPMPFEELKQLADFGTISAVDEIRPAGSSDWVAAASIDQLGLRHDDNRTVVVTCDGSDTDIPVVHSKQAADEWYCMLGGQELGPLSFGELAEYVEHEQLAANDEVKLGEHGKWRRVGSIGRLMAVIPYQAVEMTIVPTAPKSRTPVVELPVIQMEFPSPRPVRGISPATQRIRQTIASPPQSDPLISTTGTRNRGDSAPAIPFNPETRGQTEPVAGPRTFPVSPTPVARSSPPASSGAGGFGSSIATPRTSSGTFGATLPKKRESRAARDSGPSWIAGLVESLKEPKALGSIGAFAVVFLLCGWSFLPKSRGADIKRYQALKQIQTDVRAKRSDPTELAALKAQSVKVGKEIADAVKKQAGRDDLAKQSLLWAARDELPRMFDGAPEAQLNAEKNFAARLQETAVFLGLEKPPATPAIINSAQLPDD